MTVRIGIDYTSAVNQRAGIGRFTRGMIDGLAKTDQTNRYALVHARGQRNPPLRLLPGNFSFRELPLGERAMTILWHRVGIPVPIEALAGRLDVFHAPDYLLPPLRRAKGIATVHDLSFLRYPECAEPNLVKFLSKAVPKSCEQATLILADSLSTKQDIVRYLSVPENKVEVVYGGVDEQFKRVSDPEILQRIRNSYPVDRPFIFSLGTVEPRKNLAALMEAYAPLRQTGGIPHRLLIGGARGWRGSGLAQVYEKLAMEEDIVFLGFIPDEDLPSLYSIADLFVYPSLYEGFGLPPLEAMACGTPVVCSNTSSLPEIAGDAAVLIDPLDITALSAAIESLLADNQQTRLMSARGLAQAARFRWEKTGQRLQSIYQRVGAS